MKSINTEKEKERKNIRQGKNNYELLYCSTKQAIGVVLEPRLLIILLVREFKMAAAIGTYSH